MNFEVYRLAISKVIWRNLPSESLTTLRNLYSKELFISIATPLLLDKVPDTWMSTFHSFLIPQCHLLQDEFLGETPYQPSSPWIYTKSLIFLGAVAILVHSQSIFLSFWLRQRSKSIILMWTDTWQQGKSFITNINCEHMTNVFTKLTYTRTLNKIEWHWHILGFRTKPWLLLTRSSSRRTKEHCKKQKEYTISHYQLDLSLEEHQLSTNLYHASLNLFYI